MSSENMSVNLADFESVDGDVGERGGGWLVSSGVRVVSPGSGGLVEEGG